MTEISNFTNGTTNPSSPCKQTEDGIPELSTFAKVIVGIIILILILIGCCGNAIVCFIIYRKQQMRSAINLLLASIALSDILVSSLCMPVSLIAFLGNRWIFGMAVCKLHAFLYEYFSTVSIFVLFVMCCDRFTIIVKRKDKLTAKFAKIFIGVVWTVPCAITFPPILGLCDYSLHICHFHCYLTISNHDYEIAFLVIKFTLGFLLPVLIMGYSFGAIGNTVRKNSSRVQNHPETEVSLSIAQISAQLGFVLIPMKSKLHIDVKFKTRTFKTIMLLYLVLVICFSPYPINQMVGNTTRVFYATSDHIIFWIACSKSAINPVIFYFRIKKYREACHEFFPLNRCKNTFLKAVSKRRVNPSVMYQYNGEVSVITTTS